MTRFFGPSDTVLGGGDYKPTNEERSVLMAQLPPRIRRFALERVDRSGKVLERHENLVGRFLKADAPFGRRILRFDPRQEGLPFFQWIHKDGGNQTTWEPREAQDFQRGRNEVFAQPSKLFSVPPPLQAPGAPPLPRVVYRAITRVRRHNVSGEIQTDPLRSCYMADDRVWSVGRMLRFPRYGTGTPSDGVDVPSDGMLKQLSMFTRDEENSVAGEGMDFVHPQSPHFPLYESKEHWDYFVGSPVGEPLFRLSDHVRWGHWRRVEWDFTLTAAARNDGLAKCRQAADERAERLSRAAERQRLRELSTVHTLSSPPPTQEAVDLARRKGGVLRRGGWR